MLNRYSSVQVAVLIVIFSGGCRQSSESRPVDNGSADTARSEAPREASNQSAVGRPQSYEASAKELLGQRLPPEQAADGWIRLFDGYTLFGWEIAGDANWRVEDGSIVVDQGEPCLLCTSIPWQDYELVVEFKAAAKTNSGIFLHTPLEPEDPALDCYEVNIAPEENPFPTASVVKRAKAEPGTSEPTDVWRTMKMRLQGNSLQVSLDDALVCEYSDPLPLAAGRIGLQHNSGRVEFRDVRLRPLGLQSLLDKPLTQWKKYPEMQGDFTSTDEGWMHVQGGKTQLESKESYGDFVLLAEYKLPADEINSGIFFRCIPGDEMMGYECQLSDQMIEGDPFAPADHGTGGIFRRQPARIVAGQTDQWVTVVLVANGPHMAAWVNGIQVSNWYDDREPDENPRRGRRLEPGTLMIQGHDETTDALLRQFKIAAMTKPPTAKPPAE